MIKENLVRELEIERRTFEERGLVSYVSLATELIHLVQNDQDFLAHLSRAWEARSFHSIYERPLLLFATLRFLALSNTTHPLAKYIGEGACAKEPIPSSVVAQAFDESPATFERLRDWFVQTNEVARAFAWILPASVIHATFRPIVLVDSACSAGLNLVGDRIDQSWVLKRGRPWPYAELPPILARFGFDRSPVDVTNPERVRWLRACIWPGQPERLLRVDRALAQAQRLIGGGHFQVEVSDIAHVPQRLDAIADAYPEAFILAYQSSVRGYLPPEPRAKYGEQMKDWVRGSRAMWLELEDAPEAPEGAADVSRLDCHIMSNRGLEMLTLAHSDFHPTVIDVDDEACRELAHLAAQIHAR